MRLNYEWDLTGFEDEEVSEGRVSVLKKLTQVLNTKVKKITLFLSDESGKSDAGADLWLWMGAKARRRQS